MQWYKKCRIEIMFSVLSLMFGMVSGYIAHAGPTIWYQSLIKPSFNPASWIFTPVWTILYLMIGFAFALALKHSEKYKKLIYFSLFQYLCNLAWSSVFFYYHRIDLALYLLLIIVFVSWICLALGSRIKYFTILWLPYCVWVSFACILNYQIYQLNS